MTFEEIQKLLPPGFHAFERDGGRIDIYDDALNRMAGSIVNNFVNIRNCYKVALLCHLDRPDIGLVLTTRQPAMTQ